MVKFVREDVQITTGVACATLPTSSSFCMIFLIRACSDRLMSNDSLNKRLVAVTHNGKLRLLVLGLHVLRFLTNYARDINVCSVLILSGRCMAERGSRVTHVLQKRPCARAGRRCDRGT